MKYQSRHISSITSGVAGKLTFRFGDRLYHDESEYLNHKNRFAQAQNPNTNPERLQELAEDKEKDVRANVARNSNTPISILEEFFHDKEIDVRANLARNSSIPISMLEKLADDKEPYIRKNVMYNINAPIDMLEKLSDDVGPKFDNIKNDMESIILDKSDNSIKRIYNEESDTDDLPNGYKPGKIIHTYSISWRRLTGPTPYMRRKRSELGEEFKLICSKQNLHIIVRASTAGNMYEYFGVTLIPAK